MTFKEAVESCHMRSSIYRKGDLWRILTQEDIDKRHPALRDQYYVGQREPKRYNKNHPVPLEERVPLEDQQFDDWAEWDPRDEQSFYLPA